MQLTRCKIIIIIIITITIIKIGKYKPKIV